LAAEVTPFTISISDATIRQTQERLRQATWPRRLGDGGWSLGISHDFMRVFADHWLNHFDWRKVEAELNAWPQYKTEIEGINLHFFHVPGEGRAPRPLLLSHGWPGSVYEFAGAIAKLTNPSAFGGRPEDAFTVVIPSLPGYGFSGAPDDRTLGPPSTARLFHTLMTERLGYQKFGVQGGDFGAVVSICLAMGHPENIVAMHLNTVPVTMRAVGELNAEELAFLAGVQDYIATEFDYFNMQRQKTNTVGFALAGNPLGTAAWILEKFYNWSDHDGDLLTALSLDQLCANVAIYVYTDTIDISVRMYNGLWTELSGAFRPPGRIEVPTGAAIFPREVRAANPPRCWADLQYNIQSWTVMPKGGHFAAFEQPDLFVADVQAFFRQYI
jgi:pimeloyl-ACP methyl ester carboxylesterase